MDQFLSYDAVLDVLNRDGKAFQNDAFKRYFEKATRFEQIQFETFDAFSNVIWHFSPYSRILTPPRWWGGGRVYTVRDVATRMIKQGWTFSELVEGSIEGVYQPSWFESCLGIYEHFDWAMCQPVMLLKPELAHRLDCPKSFYRLIDGIHRSLVITYLVLKGELVYRPVNGILIRYD